MLSSLEIKQRINYFLRIFAFLLLLLSLLYASLWGINIVYKSSIPANMINADSGNAYYIDTKLNIFMRYLFTLNGDDGQDNQRSRLSLFEDGKQLGPSHVYHETIRKEGKGLYSHWGRSLYFSASDNSNPTNNGRSYSYEIRLLPDFVLLIFMISFSLLFLKAKSTWMFLIKLKNHIFKLLCIILPLILYYILLKMNVINPFAISGKILYLLLLFTALVLYLISIFQIRKISILNRPISIALTALISLLWIALLLETAARLIPEKNTLAVNPAVKFTWPDWLYYKMNKAGHRDREFSVEKPANTFRILCAGDSFTEGAGVSRKEAYPSQLEQILNERLSKENTSLRVEVFNLGHCGYNTSEEVGVIKKDSAVYKPDMVTIGYVINDAELHTPAEINQGAYRVTPIWCERLHNFFINNQKSYVYYRFFCRITIFRPTPSANSASLEDVILVQHRKDYPGWKNVEESLKELDQLSQARNFKVIGIIFPMFYCGNESGYLKQYGSIHEQVMAEFQKNKIEVYDLFNNFSSNGNRFVDYAYSPADAHPNAKAHKRTAEILADKIWNTKELRTALENKRTK